MPHAKRAFTNLSMVVLATVGAVGCSSSEPTTTTDAGATNVDGRTTVSAADGKAACYAVCETQTNLKCSKVAPSYGETCRAICDGAYGKAPAACASTRGSYDVCTRDRVTYSCTDSGGLGVSPTGACGSAASACLACSSSAGLSCWGLF